MEHTRINKGLVTREDAGKTIMPVGHKWPDYHGAMDGAEATFSSSRRKISLSAITVA